jgi:hypothetical protein
MISNLGDPNIPMQQGKPLSDDDRRLKALFDDMRKGQLDFLDQASKRVIELSTGLLGVLFAVTAFGKDFPPPYLKSNPVTQYLALGVVTLLMLALLAGVRTIQPRAYTFPEADLTRMREELQTILAFKSRWMRMATWLFCTGAGLLAVLIASLIV